MAFQYLIHIYFLQGNIEKFKEGVRECLSLANQLNGLQKIGVLILLLNPIYSRLPESAAQLLGVIDILQRADEVQIDPLGKRNCNRAEGHARKVLGNAAFEEAYKKGRAMTLEQAVASILQNLDN